MNRPVASLVAAIVVAIVAPMAAQMQQAHEIPKVPAALADAVTAYEAADRIERAYLAAEKIPAEYEWHHEHNLDLLGASYAYLGRMRDAERALKEAFNLPTALAVQRAGRAHGCDLHARVAGARHARRRRVGSRRVARRAND